MCGYHCGQCGRCQGKLQVKDPGTCPVCDTVNDPEATKCVACGAPLARLAGTLPNEARRPSSDRSA